MEEGSEGVDRHKQGHGACAAGQVCRACDPTVGPPSLCSHRKGSGGDRKSLSMFNR